MYLNDRGCRSRLMLGNFFKTQDCDLRTILYSCTVISGVIFAIFTCVCYVTRFAEFSFDDILKEVCSILLYIYWISGKLKSLKSGGKSLSHFLILVIILIICQGLSCSRSVKALQISPLVGLCRRVPPYDRWCSTAGAFGPVLEDFGVKVPTRMYSCCYIWIDHWKYHGRSRWKTSD